MGRIKFTEKTKGEKKKIMLWIDIETLDKIELVKPEDITIQEAIRQILHQSLENV